MRSRLTLFLTLFSFNLLSQNSQIIKLEGTLLSIKNEEPIGFANIYLSSDLNVGNNSNQNGDFFLNIEKYSTSDSIVISHILYEQKKIAIQEILENPDSLVIRLNEKPSILNEITVFSNNEFADKILGEMMKQLKKNYPRSLFYLESYYREIDYRLDAGPLFYSEAVLHLQDRNWRRGGEELRVQQIASRSTEDKGTYSRPLHYFEGLVKRLLDLPTNKYHDLYRTNMILNLMSSESMGTNFLGENYTVRLSDIQLGDDNDSIYTIMYRFTDSYAAKFENSVQLKHRGMLKINSKDKACIYSENHTSTNNSISSKYLSFRNVEGRYYPNYILTKGHKMNTKNKNEIKYRLLQITKISTNRRDFDRIRRRNSMGKNDDIVLNQNLEFWDSYNYVDYMPEQLNELKSGYKQITE